MLHSSAALVFCTHATFGLQSLEAPNLALACTRSTFHLRSSESAAEAMECCVRWYFAELHSVVYWWLVHTVPLQKQWNNVHRTLLLLYCSCSRVRKCTRAEEWCSISSWLSGRLCNVQCASIPKSFHLPPDQTPLICKHTCFCQNLKKTYFSKLLHIHYANEGPP